MTRTMPTVCGRFLVVGLLLGLTGCQGVFSRWGGRGLESDLQANVTPSVPPVNPEQAELPAGESALLCLTTAESMDRSGRVGEAIALYTKARQLDPRQKGVCRRLAVLYDRVGEFALASNEYTEALRLTPNDAALLNDVGYSCYCQGKVTDAEDHLRKSIELDPKQERAWVNLGLSLAMQGRYSEGLDAFKKVLPEAQAQANLAFVQSTQGKRYDAMASYRKALQADPQLPVARSALVMLEKMPANDSRLTPQVAEALTRVPARKQVPAAPASGIVPVSYDEPMPTLPGQPQPFVGVATEPQPVGASGFTPMR